MFKTNKPEYYLRILKALTGRISSKFMIVIASVEGSREWDKAGDIKGI